jgi:ABC-type nitrate/sulfonate/bicarbonate transport system permease component
VLWALPTWKPTRSPVTEVTLSETLIFGTILVVPIIFSSSCYFKLTSTHGAPSQFHDTGFLTAKLVFIHSVLICVLWQMWLPSLGWPWHWLGANPSPWIGVTVLLLIAAVVLVINVSSRIGYQHTLNARREMILGELRQLTTSSIGGAALIVLAFVILWEVFKNTLKTYLLLSPPAEVLSGLYRLLISGSMVIPNAKTTLWPDINVSLLEVVIGLILAGSLGILTTTLTPRGERPKFIISNALMLAEIAPIGLWMTLLVTIPGFIPFWSKATMAACLAFYPLTHTLRCLNDYPVICRLLLALEQALPFAFVGMIFGELFGGTAGLSFVATVASASLQVPEAIATSLVEFGLLAGVSTVIRCVVKHIYFSDADLKVVASTVA